MHSNLAGWLERIEKGTLPALPLSVEALAKLARDPDAALSAYAAVIDRDPGLTVAVLRRVRSLRTRRLTTEITTVNHALMLLGLTQVRALLHTIPVMDQAVSNEAVRDRLLALCLRGNQAAFHARTWARMRKDIEPDEVQCATLLHDLAEMLLWLHAPEEMRKVEALLAEKPEMPAHEAHYMVFGFTLEELAAQLDVPPLTRESLLAENAQHPRVTGVMLATRLARATERGWYTAAVTAVLEQIATHLRLDFDAATALVHRVAADAARALPCSRIAPAAAALLFPSQPEAARGYVFAQAVPGICLSPQPHLLREALHKLQQHEHGGLGLKETLQLATETMHEAIGLNRVVFASLSTDRLTLTARNVIDPEQDPKFSRFEVDLREGNLFEQLMRKPQALWYNETNREKFASLLPRNFTELVGADSFFILSIFVGDKPVGLFYADRHHSTCAIDATAYHQFKQLGLQAARTLAGAMGK